MHPPMQHISTVFADVLLFVILQVSGVTFDVNVRLQLAGLGGAILAVRTIDKRAEWKDTFKVALSGLVLSNFSGFAFCEYYEIPLTSFTASFVVFAFGICSDIILRIISAAGRVLVDRTREVTNAAIDVIKNLFKLKSKN